MQKSSKSIAVLPFVNMSNDVNNEYFSDGITEEIINALTNIKELKVIARTSSFAFKGKQVDIRKVGKQLNVATILEGSVRKAMNRVRITAQLIDASDGTHYWSKNFDRELDDIFKLQDEISLLIANEVRNNFGHFDIQDHLVTEVTSSIEAYELFLKGRYYQLQWTPDALREAINYYNKAIEKDKNYAKAYYANLQCFGLLAAWGYMPYQEGIENAERNFLIAKELDTQLPEYPLSFVGKTFWGEWDFKSAYGYIEQVLAINPNHIDGLEAMAELFIAHGLFDQAENYARKLLDVDPLSANNHYTLAHIHYYQKDFKTALTHVNRALRIRPDLELAKHLQALCLLWLNKKEEFENATKNNPLYQLQTILFQVINENNQSLSETLIESWKDVDKERSQLAPYELFILANTAHKAEAFNLLKKYIEQRRGQIINYRQDPLLEPLKQFEDFVNLHTSNFSIDDVSELNVEKANNKLIIDPTEQIALKKKLVDYIEDETPYLDSQLNLKFVADALEIHPNKLSYLINEVMGVNFNEFINQYRLKHFKSIALKPELKHITILGLAYDSGFNSKSVFNTFFKKSEGVTPSKWVQLHSI
ncbi:Adenylate cyclase [Xanthomarina gelatinilytica]|uniref:Adenylate cyclase n=1 Tax=Xanthomarina gelatinilytica TaxID=1137281 RepID=M7MJX7_9FLAO|nr:helix-turn-helix domain-containing protein [Xanthomarina gelatinilytica]EMQ95366.1 Adenylate cyclase [Xanthomarina gelatinilytica]